MPEQKSTILLVDDEPLNITILEENLESAGYTTVSVSNGMDAWQELEKSHAEYDAVLLDRMMPKMDGMELLERMKSHEVINTLPVIMQTAKVAADEVLEGLKAGVHYYLTKPYSRGQLLAVVKTVVSNYQHQRKLEESIDRHVGTFKLMTHGVFTVCNLEDAYNLSALLASSTPNAEKVVMGLSELLTNALEHGNLGIGYEEKTQLNLEGVWQEELERRLQLPENQEKKVKLTYECRKNEINFIIKDQGDGFDWKKYMELTQDRIFDSHGRGIVLANMVCFDHVEYLGNGNQVVAKVILSDVSDATN